MAQITFTQAAGDDLQRLEAVAAGALDLIRSAVSVLANHPFIGRPAELGARELIISRGKTGCVALYDFDEALDQVIVLALRHQREAGI